MCRFINADSVDVLDEDQNNVLENNLFAYCLNNPVNMVDDGKMSNAIRSTATLGILIIVLFFGKLVIVGGIALFIKQFIMKEIKYSND